MPLSRNLWRLLLLLLLMMMMMMTPKHQAFVHARPQRAGVVMAQAAPLLPRQQQVRLLRALVGTIWLLLILSLMTAVAL